MEFHPSQTGALIEEDTFHLPRTAESAGAHWEGAL